MTDRIQEVLDGTRSREELDVAERRELAAFEAALSGMLETLPDDVAPDLSRAVLWRVRELEPAPGWVPGFLVGPRLALAGALRWFWAPRAVRVRPALAFALMGLVLLLPLAGSRLDGGEEPSLQSMRLLVQFRLAAESADQVALVGDFTGWDSRYPLEEVSPGVWSIVVPLEPGMYDYAFVVDGERWALDPLAPSVADGFGGENSRIAVLAPERGGAL